MDDKRLAAAAPVRWLDLTPELWAAIGRRLDTRTDIHRFRSVCSTWRSLLPRPPAPFFPLSVPHPHFAILSLAASFPASISVATVFRLEPPPQASPLDASSASRPGWLIKISDSNQEGETESSELDSSSALASASNSGTKVRFLKQLCCSPILYKQGTFPEHIDLLNFRVTEVCREYTLQGLKGFAADVEKVLISPDSPWLCPEDTVTIAIAKPGSLLYWKYGQETWTRFAGGPDDQCLFDDIILYKGQFYAVDRFGTVSWIDSSMRAIQFSPPMCGGGGRKHLIESGGDIFVVDRYYPGPINYRVHIHLGTPEAVDFRVYRLDQEWGKWDEVRNLGEAVFFIGTSCSFSVSVWDFDGCPGNCIYFVNAGKWTERVHVFTLANRSIKRAAFSSAYLQILWPPPSWLTPIRCIPDPNVRISIL